MWPVGRLAHAQAGKVPGTAAEWSSYGGDKASSKYSPLDQIDADNFHRLKVAWTWRSPDEEIVKANPRLKTWVWESTPLMVGGVLYVSTSLSQVAAIDAATGKTRWVYDPETWKNGTPSNNGFVHRGVAYWADGDDQRILFGTGDGYLICLDAQTGKPIPTFGQQGRIDLTQGLGRPVDRHLYGVSSPPIICRDVVVMGSKVHDFPLAKVMPPGDVRGFDVRTGEQRWLFRSVPGEGEFGNETWDAGFLEDDGRRQRLDADERGRGAGLRLPALRHALQRLYGGQRPGNGLFGESLVCLDARTGKRVWHFQMVHHGLWDYDLPAAPNLIDIRVNGAARQGRRAVEQAGLLLRLRPRDRQADLAHRGAARPAVHGARRTTRRRRSPSRPDPHPSTGRGSRRTT